MFGCFQSRPRYLAVSLIFALGGCAAEVATDDLPRHAVEGTVTWRGKPLDSGKIQFEPATPESKGVLEVAEIKSGAFALDTTRGLVPGDYKVMISSIPPPQPLEPGEAPGGMPKQPKETIPAKYNRKSELTAKVPTDGEATEKFEFALSE